jgi:DUF2075 family protein
LELWNKENGMNNRDEIQKKYDDNHTIRISLKLNLKTDKDIIDKIDMNRKQASIKELIRKGIKSSK